MKCSVSRSLSSESLISTFFVFNSLKNLQQREALYYFLVFSTSFLTQWKNFWHVMGVFSTSKYVLVLLIMAPINHRCKLKVSKQAAWPRKVVIPSWTSQNPSLHYESLWGQIGRQSWHTHMCTHTCTRTRSCCSFILIGPLQRVMIGYAWLSKAVVFGATATPPDASDLNSPLCRPGCCGTSFCKYTVLVGSLPELDEETERENREILVLLFVCQFISQ